MVCKDCGISIKSKGRRCRSCAGKASVEKRRNTNILNHGENWAKKAYLKGQIKIKEKYGADNISKTSYFKEKYKQKMNQKYGVDNYYQRTDLMKVHWKESLGVENPMSNNEISLKSFTTKKSLYVLKGAVPKEVSEKTCLEKYGNINFFGSKVGKMSYENLVKNYDYSKENIKSISKRKDTMSINWALLKSNNNIEKAHKLVEKRMISTQVKKGRASKESLKTLIPLYKECRRLGIKREEIFIGIKGSREYYIIDKEKFFLYDFTIKSKTINLMIEFHGIKFHPKQESEGSWKSLYGKTKEECLEKDNMKKQLAIKNGFKIIEVYSDDVHRLEKSIIFIKENIL